MPPLTHAKLKWTYSQKGFQASIIISDGADSRHTACGAKSPPPATHKLGSARRKFPNSFRRTFVF